MSVRKCTAFLFLVAAYSVAQNRPSVIGEGWGLDHIIFGMPNAETVEDIFGTKLGFSPVPGNRFPGQGLEQAIVSLPPAYLEFLWPYQKPTDADELTARLLQKVGAGGGPFSYNIDVSPVQQATNTMRRLGISVTLPPSRIRRTPDGKEAPGAWQFISIDSDDQKAHPFGVPGGPGVGWLEYTDNADRLTPDRFRRSREQAEKAVPDLRRLAGEIHPNTARKVLSVWVVVPEIADAARQNELFGLTGRGTRYFEAVGEKGSAFQCGQGTLVFFQPMNQTSPLAVLVKKSGYGLFGVSIAVADIKKAEQIVEQGTGRKFSIERAEGRSGFVVPAELAAGTFVEFVQQ
jgi:Glyoxalase-like domain